MSVASAHDPKKCTMIPERERFEREKTVMAGALIEFKGLPEQLDVYNCSVPFFIDGVKHIYGRAERREEWANSYVHLFRETAPDEFSLVKEAVSWRMEDPFVVKIQGEMLLGGVRVTKNKGQVCDYCCDFFRGTPDQLVYFTSGPQRMKDIRLIELIDGRIGLFSHHKSDNKCITGFATIDKLSDLSMEVINSAKPIDHTAFGDAWGGVNQAYLLSSGKIGCISHHGYLMDKNEETLNVYCITSFVYDPETNLVHSYRILGTKCCYPAYPPKVSRLSDCAFVSGICRRLDGKYDLYSGLGDTCEGRMPIEYPFQGHGEIISDLEF